MKPPAKNLSTQSVERDGALRPGRSFGCFSRKALPRRTLWPAALLALGLALAACAAEGPQQGLVERLEADVTLDLLFIGPLDSGSAPCVYAPAVFRGWVLEAFRGSKKFRPLPEEKLAAVSGGTEYTLADYSAGDFRLARELGRRVDADFVYIIDRLCGPRGTNNLRLVDVNDPQGLYSEWADHTQLRLDDQEGRRRVTQEANRRLLDQKARDAIVQALFRKVSAAPKGEAERPPVILIAQPEGGSVVGTPRVLLQGTASADGQMARVALRVNGEHLALSKPIDTRVSTVNIREEIPLRMGENTIELEAVDDRGRRAVHSVRLRRAAPPRIEALEPQEPGPIRSPQARLLLEVADEEGLEEVRLFLNGEPIPLEPVLEPRSWRLDRQLSLEVGRNELIIMARNRFGLEARRTLSVVREAPAPSVLAPPLIFISSPRKGFVTEAESVTLTGAVKGVGRAEVAEVKVLLNGSPIQGRDISVRGKGDEIALNLNVPLRMGENRIEVVARDSLGLEGREVRVIKREVARGQLVAVVIGVNAYKKVAPLRYAANDARAFHDYLISDLGVSRDRVKLLLDQDVTLRNVRSALGTWLPSQAGKHDTALIYFAGHGATEDDPASPDGDSLSKYLLPMDADIQDLYGSAFPMEEVARVFSRIRSGRVLFIGDTCYSGASGGRTLGKPGSRSVKLSDKFLERVSQGEGRVILTASGPNELAKEDDTLKHGVFTYYFLQALRRNETDLNGDGFISLGEIYSYVSREVAKVTEQRQRPVLKGEVTGEVILGRVKGR